jgi:hypothetical protein
VKLTEKDLLFLETLRRLLEHHDLRVECCSTYLRLRQNYGDHIELAFHMTRQGVRWRFQRITEMYISSFQTILAVEQVLGTEVRNQAIRVSTARHESHRDASAFSPSARHKNRGERSD